MNAVDHIKETQDPSAYSRAEDCARSLHVRRDDEFEKDYADIKSALITAVEWLTEVGIARRNSRVNRASQGSGRQPGGRTATGANLIQYVRL
jgi:hypothetical protein